VLDEELAARALFKNLGLKLAGGVKLVIAGENDFRDLLFLVAPGDQIAAQDFQPAIALPNFFPQIARAVAMRVRRVALRAVVPPY